MSYFHKLKPDELARFVNEADAKRITERSKKRQPRKFDDDPVRVYLNRPKTIWVQSIHFSGGENFNEPYFFIAEITHATTGSAFRRWINRCPCPEVFRRMASTY